MSYQSAIDHLAAMAPELATQTGQTRRKFSLDEVAILLAASAIPSALFPPSSSPEPTEKVPRLPRWPPFLQPPGCAPASTRRRTWRGPTSASASTALKSPTLTLLSTSSAFAPPRQKLVEEKKLAQPPSFFETLTAMAFLHFAEPAIEIAVLEVGLGGRLDATNIVDPLLSIITDISLDHMEWLGSTISEIAREKAGILRPGGTLVTLPQHPEANQVLGEVATSLSVLGVSAVPFMPAVTAAIQPIRLQIRHKRRCIRARRRSATSPIRLRFLASSSRWIRRCGGRISIAT